MCTIKEALIQAKNEDTFLQTVLDLSLGNPGHYQDVADGIVYLHNNNLIDAINEFYGLTKVIEKSKFLAVLHVFELALPHLKDTVKRVIACLKHLIKEGEQIVVGIISPPLIKYFVSESSRPNEAIDLIQFDSAEWYDFIAPCLMAGAVTDFQYFYNKTMQLKQHNNIEIRKRAIFVLGKINYPKNNIEVNASFNSLNESINEENDNNLLGNLVVAIFNLFLIDSSLEMKAINSINNALSKAGDFTLHAISQIFMQHAEGMSKEFLSMFRFHLSKVLAVNEMTINNIDYGITKLIKHNNVDEAIHFLEYLLLATDINIKVFDSAVYLLCNSHKEALNKIATLWLLRGEYKLCIALKYIMDSQGLENISLEVDPMVIGGCRGSQLIYLARKAVGYLFFKPVTAASILTSLLDYADTEIAKEIESLLFYPLLINYSGSVLQYLTDAVKVKTGIAKNAIQASINQLSSYLKNLQVEIEIKELWPELSQREAYSRHHHRNMSSLYKEAQKNSIFTSTTTQCVMLYGKKSINYIYALNGQSNRVEIPMQKYGVTIEIPRLESLDPCSIQYLLHICRAEKPIL